MANKYAAQIVQDIDVKERGGFGKGPDTSDDFADMNYAEKIVLDPDFLVAIADFKVATKVVNPDGTEKVTGGHLLLTKEDIMQFREKNIEMNGVAHKVNSVFVALEIPFRADSFATDSAQKIVKTKKSGENVGETYTTTQADRLRIYRVTEKFDIDKYAASKSKRVLEEGVTDYNEPTEGMRKREARWMEENGSKLGEDILKKIGFEWEVKNKTEETTEGTGATTGSTE